MPCTHSQNLRGHHSQSTGRLSSAFFDISKGHALIPLLMADQIKNGSQNLIYIVMLIGHQVQTGNPLADTYFYLQAVPYHGARRSKQPSHYQQQRPSTLPLPTLPSKSYGIDRYSMDSEFHSPRHQFYSRTIKPRSLYHIIPNFTHTPNTSISLIIFYAT